MRIQEELLKLADFMVEKEGIYPVKIIFKNVKAGMAHCRFNKKSWITIPTWIFEDDSSNEFRYYYIIHEMCHVTLHYKGFFKHGHRDNFKKMEKKYLDIFGIRVEYKITYPKKIYSNNVIFFEKKI